MAEQGDPVPDDGAAVHYTAVAPGTPVYASDGVEVGKVKEMLDNRREHIFDGVVYRDTGGGLRFADAPEVARTAERGVTLTLSAEQAAELGPPETGGAGIDSTPGGSSEGGMFGRLFGRRRS